MVQNTAMRLERYAEIFCIEKFISFIYLSLFSFDDIFVTKNFWKNIYIIGKFTLAFFKGSFCC